MRTKVIVAVLTTMLNVGIWGQVRSVELDLYPLGELSATTCDECGHHGQVGISRLSLLAGLIEWEQRPDWIKFRLAPLLYQRLKNQHYIQPILLGGADYRYDSRQGVAQELAQLDTDLAYTALFAWRGKENDEPYLAGGTAALLGEILVNYGFKSSEGSRYRAWALTEALVYRNDEKFGREFFSAGGLIFSFAWDRPKQPKTWSFCLAAKCLSVGRVEGKTYGRLLWIPIGQAPPLFSRVRPAAKEEKKPVDERQPLSTSPKRVTL